MKTNTKKERDGITMEQFSLGFWNTLAASKTTLGDVDDWKDLSMNLTLAPSYDAACDKEHFLSILDKGHENGIKFILHDPRSRWHSLTQNGEEAFREGFAEMLTDFGSHPATWGYHVGDEPGKDQLEDACDACRIGKEMAPHLKAFLNLNPWWENIEQNYGYDDFFVFMGELVRRSQIDLICYDCYEQMTPGKEGVDHYFRALWHYSKAAERNNIPFWTVMMSMGLYNYRVPNLHDFRWQLNTAAACGAKGALWYYLYEQNHGFYNNIRAPFLFGRKTPTYDDLWEAQITFKNFFANTLANLTLEKVEFTKEAFGGYPLFSGDGIIAPPKGEAGGEYENNLLFSHFKDSAGQRYVMVTNMSFTDNVLAIIYLKGEDRRVFLYHYGDREQEIAKGRMYTWNSFFESKNGYTTVPQYLAPGQAFLFRWE